MKKFDDYWRPGRPYLDGAELKVVKEPATCSALMQSGQADAWMSSTAQETADLKAMGFQIVQTPTIYNVIYPDSKNPESPFANKKVREALEYAIDRAAMAEALWRYGRSTLAADEDRQFIARELDEMARRLERNDWAIMVEDGRVGEIAVFCAFAMSYPSKRLEAMSRNTPSPWWGGLGRGEARRGSPPPSLPHQGGGAGMGRLTPPIPVGPRVLQRCTG